MFALFLLSLGIGIFSILIALPLLAEKVQPNPFYGFRVRATLEDRKLWYAVNKYFANRLLLAGIAEVFVALALFGVPNISPDTYTLGTLGVFAIVFTVGMMQTSRYLKSMQRNDRGSAVTPGPGIGG